MKLKIAELLVPEEDPFRNDKLSRRDCVEAVCQILSIADEPIVIAICSPWGTGKTTFLRMLNIVLGSRDFPTISLNAWENDFADNPIVSILGEIERGLSSFASKKASNPRITAILQNLVRAGLELVRTAVPIAVRTATAGLLPLPPAVQMPVADLLSKVLEDQLNAYKKAGPTLEDFRLKLLEAAREMSTSEEHRPLVILVDELDRCRPSYAVEFLEVMKHFFNVNNIAFLLAIDESQLSASIKSTYGPQIDSTEYLRKFIDLRYSLPPGNLETYTEGLFDRYELEPYFQERAQRIPSFRGELGEFRQTSRLLFAAFNMSLRAQEQCLTHLSLVLRTTPTNMVLLPSVLSLLIVLRNCDAEYYKKIVNRSVSASQIVKDLAERFTMARVNSDRFNMQYMEALLAIVMDGAHQAAEQYTVISRNDSADQMERAHAGDITRIIEQVNMNYQLHKVLDYLVNKIELLDRFI